MQTISIIQHVRGGDSWRALGAALLFFCPVWLFPIHVQRGMASPGVVPYVVLEELLGGRVVLTVLCASLLLIVFVRCRSSGLPRHACALSLTGFLLLSTLASLQISKTKKLHLKNLVTKHYTYLVVALAAVDNRIIDPRIEGRQLMWYFGQVYLRARYRSLREFREIPPRSIVFSSSPVAPRGTQSCQPEWRHAYVYCRGP